MARSLLSKNKQFFNILKNKISNKIKVSNRSGTLDILIEVRPFFSLLTDWRQHWVKKFKSSRLMTFGTKMKAIGSEEGIIHSSVWLFFLEKRSKIN